MLSLPVIMLYILRMAWAKFPIFPKQKIAGSELELIVVNFAKDKMTLRIPMAKAENAGLRKISEASTMNDALSVLKGKAKVKKNYVVSPRSGI